MNKSLDVENIADAQAKVNDIKVFGNGDMWMLLGKASSASQGWMKSTKAMNVAGGVIVQVSTQQGDNVAEAVTFVPNAVVVKGADGQPAYIMSTQVVYTYPTYYPPSPYYTTYTNDPGSTWSQYHSGPPPTTISTTT